MGGNESTMKNKSTTNVTNDFMQKISTDVENRNEAELNLDQTLTFRAPFATMKNCSLRIDQNQKGTLRATMDAMASMTTEQVAELSADIANAQSQALEQANSGLNMPGTTNESNVENEIETNVRNNLEMSVEKTFKNMNYASGSAAQDLTIDLYGMQCDGSNILINQNQALEVVAENLSETINDTVQSGEAVSKITNEQTQKVKQVNEGIGSAGSSGSSCSSSLLILIAGFAAAAPKIKKMMDGKKGGFPKFKGGSHPGMTPNPQFDGSMPSNITDVPVMDVSAKKGFNWVMFLGISAVIIVLGVLIGILIYYYTPEYPCPSEEDCNKAWDEIKAAEPRVPAPLLRKYHNCRIRHRAKGIKPEKFRPRCETYCAYLEREEATPGIKPNPLKWLYCTGAGGDEEEDAEEGDAEEGDAEEEDAEEEDAEEEDAEEPEGFSDYY